jgi:uncharacterized protein
MRRAFRLMLWITTLCLIVITAAILWAGNELASPASRSLQEYHREFLADPSAHGVSVQSFTLSDATPCLMIQPDAEGKLGTRGLKVREQLMAEGISIPAPGQILGTLVLVHGRKGRK